MKVYCVVYESVEGGDEVERVYTTSEKAVAWLEKQPSVIASGPYAGRPMRRRVVEFDVDDGEVSHG